MSSNVHLGECLNFLCGRADACLYKSACTWLRLGHGTTSFTSQKNHDQGTRMVELKESFGITKKTQKFVKH